MKRHEDTKRFTLLGVLAIILLALLGLTAMALVLHKQDMRGDWKTQNIVTLDGSITCLPHKNSDQPHTLECASGLKVNDVYYALKSGDNTVQVPSNGDVTVTGIYKAPVSDEKYNTVGTLEVKAVIQKD